MTKYKQQVIDFFNSRTAYDAEGDSHPKEAQRLLNLSPAQKELLQAEYQKAVGQLIADRGVWQESINLYVKAFK